MATFGVCMVRDAEDIIGPVVRHMLTQVDHVIVADNLSTDRTRDILDGLPITVLDDHDPAHEQGRKTTALAHRAMLAGADWVVPFDSDEVWYSPFGRIADVLANVEQSISSARLYDHVPTAIDSASDPNPLTRIGWRRRAAGALPKVAVRTHNHLRIHEGNHGADCGPFGGRTVPGLLVVRHFPYRSAEQMLHKALIGAEALRRSSQPQTVGAHWRAYAALVEARGPSVLADVFAEHFHSADPMQDPGLIFDPAPCA